LLLDGQQRIATAAILLSVIRDYLHRYSRDAAVRVSNRYLTDFDDALNDITFKLTLNRYDRDFFKREILETREGSYTPPTPDYDSHRLIRKARGFFERKFEEKYTAMASPSDSHAWAIRILRVLTGHVSVVAVISDDEDNASNVFETLNDRGIGLSTPDLLRNLVLRRAAEEYLDEILDLWGEVLQIDNDAKLQDFFRHFWLSREGDVKARALYREVKTHITEHNTNSLSFSRELRDSSRVYRDILNSIHDGSDAIASLLADINLLGAKVLYPPTLSILESTDDVEVIQRFLHTFIITYVRHTLIAKKENSQIENIMFSLAKEIRESQNDEMLQRLVDFAPSNEQFEDGFKIATISRRASARYVLRKLEEHKRTTDELDVAPPSRVHVEHIYPQTPREGERLPQHSSLINRIGNLTLLAARLNTAIRNSNFVEKTEAYRSSELLITNQLPCTYSEWNADTIHARQEALAATAVSIWTF
jgi:hypothetical protein